MPRHVRPGDDGDAPRCAIDAGKIAIIGDERLAVAGERRLDDRMAAALDDEIKRIVDLGAGPVAYRGKLRQRRRDIDGGERLGHRLDRWFGGKDLPGELFENADFPCQRLVRGRRNLGLKLGELRSRETHRAGHRLAMHEGRVERRLQQLFTLRLRHFDEIAEEIIVLELELLGLGPSSVLRLQFGDDFAALVAQGAQPVEIDVVARTDKITVARLQRQLARKRIGEPHRDVGIGCRGLLRIVLQALGQRRDDIEPRGNRLGDAQGIADRGEVARPAALEREPRQGAREIGGGLETGAQIASQIAILT